MKTNNWMDEIEASWSEKTKRNIARRRKVWSIEHKMFRTIPWMGWPILGYIFSFWATLFEEGIKHTCKPRWGAVTFGWLNDGCKPTVWHTWHSLTCHSDCEYSGIYPYGAPKSYRQAAEWRYEGYGAKN